MAIDYKVKIKKLLALADSPNENEAKAALMKARELMAEHKLREADCMDTRNMTVVRRLTGLTCTKRNGGWMAPLGATLADSYCCKSFRNHKKGSWHNEIGFVGFSDDVDICEAVFKYAVDCIQSYCNELRIKHKGNCDAESIRKICEAYGYGFLDGIMDMYEEQNEKNQEWGIVLVVPQEVEDYCSNKMGKPKSFGKAQEPASINEMTAMLQGREDGLKFDPTHKLEEEIA